MITHIDGIPLKTIGESIRARYGGPRGLMGHPRQKEPKLTRIKRQCDCGRPARHKIGVDWQCSWCRELGRTGLIKPKTK